MTALADCVRFLDTLLDTPNVPDYDQALNGLQLQNAGTVTRVGVAVDFSAQSVQQSVAAGINLLIVHHGMFWGGTQPLTGTRYDRLRVAIANGLAVYASHLPLDLHRTVGNNVRLAEALGLTPAAGFGRYRTIEVGVAGRNEVPTVELVARVRAFTEPLGAHVVATPHTPDRRTRSWAILTGAGASSDTIAEAAGRGIDTLIVGEGPHHTAVDAMERGMVVVYAGHYATETLGVQALGGELQRKFSLPWTFLHSPTGL